MSFIVSDFTHLESAINAVDDELVLDSDVTMTDAEADKYKTVSQSTKTLLLMQKDTQLTQMNLKNIQHRK